jgi:hypothetical protein
MGSFRGARQVKHILFVWLFLLSQPVLAATYYIAPYGSDSAAGTSSSSPWKTFSFAIPRLNPGDTLILRDGTYDSSNSGFPSLTCGSNAKDGTATAPITLKAENERKAFLAGDGRTWSLYLQGCSYWTFIGLRIKGGDYGTTASSSQYGGLAGGFTTAVAYSSDHLVFRHLLVTNANRYCNCHLLLLVDTGDSLVEESEFYYYHRHALITANYNGAGSNIYRRNYVNSRGYPNIPNGYGSDSPPGGDAAYVIYPGSHFIVENNISENSGSNGIDIEADGTSIDNKILGNIDIGSETGIFLGVRGNDLAHMPQDTYVENFISLNNQRYGGRFLSNRNTQCVNCSFIGSRGYGAAVNDLDGWWSGAPSPTTYFTNTLSTSNASYGFMIKNQADWKINFGNAVSNPTNYFPGLGDSHITNSRSSDPLLGTCKAWVPDNSPMKHAGLNGADIGGNVLYRYQNGVLTNQPLWDPVSGKFPHGAIVAGINDIPGSSAFDVNVRLNINTNGCPFPSGYGGSAPIPTPTVDTVTPTVTIISPANGAVIPRKAVVTLSSQ